MFPQNTSQISPKFLTGLHIYISTRGSVVNNPRVKLVCVRIGICEHFANIFLATGYIGVTPEVSGCCSNRNQSLILLKVLTHSYCV